MWLPPLPNLIQQAKAGVLLPLLSCIWMQIHLRRAGMTWHCFARCSFGATYPTIAGGTVEKSCLVACRRQHRTHAILLSLRMFQENSNEGRGSAFFFGLPHNDNWYMRNRVIHIALFCSRFNKRASFCFFLNLRPGCCWGGWWEEEGGAVAYKWLIQTVYFDEAWRCGKQLNITSSKPSNVTVTSWRHNRWWGFSGSWFI